MDKYLDFKNHIRESALRFSSLDEKQTIRIISHLDADGICAASILIFLMNRKNMMYDLSIVPQLSSELIDEYAQEPATQYFFTDIGSAKISDIARKFKDKKVFILDHHSIDAQTDFVSSDRIVHINPHMFGIDGGKKISGSGIVFLFAREICPEVDNMSHLPLIGAIGDIQEDLGFMGLNKDILDVALSNEKVIVQKGLRLFGTQTRPLYKLLEYSTDIFIPGVSCSETGAIMFLNKLGIPLKHGKDWTRIIDLSNDDLQKLTAAIIMQRSSGKIKDPENIFASNYLLADEKTGTPTRDLREFSTVLNSCGRMNKASLGIGLCLGDPEMKKKAMHHLDNYKKEIVYALNWFRQSIGSDQIIEGKKYVIINAKDSVIPTIIGTLASIISKQNKYEDNTFILSLARNAELGQIKVSLRICGSSPDKSIDLRTVIQKIVEKSGGEAGGHQFAAGAVVPISEEESFIKAAVQVFSDQ